MLGSLLPLPHQQNGKLPDPLNPLNLNKDGKPLDPLDPLGLLDGKHPNLLNPLGVHLDGLLDKALRDLGINDLKTLEELKPKLIEIITKLKAEENNICKTAHDLHLDSILNKIPLLPRILHRFPDSLKDSIKGILHQILGQNSAISLASLPADEISQAINDRLNTPVANQNSESSDNAAETNQK